MKLGLGLALNGSSSASGVSYETEATTYFAAMSVAPDATRKGHLNTLIASLKTAGVWAKLDWLAIHAAHDEQAGRINAKTPAQVATAVNTPTFTTDRGFTGNGTSSYLNTGINVSTAGGLYLQNDCHLGVWVGTDVSASSQIDIGTSLANICSRTVGNTAHAVQSASTSTVALSSSTSVGHSVYKRDGASSGAVYKNGVNLSSIATASTARRNAVTLICAINGSSTGTVAPANYSTRRIQASHFGGALSDAETLALYNALSTYMTAVGA